MFNLLRANIAFVFTSKHSTFPEPIAVKAESRMPRYFVDTIPLLICWKDVERCIIDVAGKNSLDLTSLAARPVGDTECS